MVEGRTIIVVDAETTGRGHGERPPRPDGVVQFGYAWRTRNGPIRSWHKTCNPGSQFLADGRAVEALRINGLTEDQVLEADSADKVAAELWEHLRATQQESGQEIEFRSYNRSFDEAFLARTPWNLQSPSWGRCIMKAAAVHLDGPQGRWPKLVDAVRRLGLRWPEGAAHNAGADSHAALLVDEVLRRAGA